jgi:hypothetical protein
MATASALLANARRAQAHADWEEATILWCAAVGDPSAGKSPAMKGPLRLLRQLEVRWNEDFEGRKREFETKRLAASEHRKRWQQDVAAAVKGGWDTPAQPEAAVEPLAPERRRLVTNDATTEAVAKLETANPRGLLLAKDELAGWMGSMDRYANAKGGDRPFYLEAWNGSDRVVDRAGKDEPLYIPHLSVAIVGGIQPDRLRSLLLSGDDDGLSARFLYFYPEQAPIDWPEFLGGNGAALAALERLLQLPMDDANGKPVPRPVPLYMMGRFDLDAWRSELRRMEVGSEGLFKSWLGKVAGTTLRVAAILEFLRWCGERPNDPEPDEIGIGALRDAITFMRDYAIPMARRCFGDALVSQEERDAAVVARWIAKRDPATAIINARELRRMPDGPPIRDPGRLEAALSALAEAGWLRAAPARAGEAKGRLRKDWAVNPKLCGTLAKGANVVR